MKQLLTIFAAWLAMMTAGLAAHADVYLVKGIKVDVTAGSSTEARTQAFEEAKVRGARTLMERLTVREDRNEAAGFYINNAVASRLAAAVDVQREKQSGTRYLGLLSVKYDQRAVEAFLSAFDVPFVNSQDALALIVPVVSGEMDPTGWIQTWYERTDDDTLAPWTGATAPYAVDANWDDVAIEARQRGALRAVRAVMRVRSGSIYVTLDELSPTASAVRRIGVVGPFSSYVDARSGVVRYMEGDWKHRSIVRAEGVSSIEAIASFTGRNEWVTISRALKTSRLVESHKVENLTGGGADISFVYRGMPEQLMADLRASGVLLRSDDYGWRLEAVLAR